MRTKIYKKITNFITKFWLIILLAGIGMAYISYSPTQKLFKNISTDLMKLLPSHYTSVKTLEKIRSLFEGGSSLAVMLESDDPLRTRECVEFTVKKLLQDPQVENIDYKKSGYKFFDAHKLLFLDIEDLETIRDRIDRQIQREKLGSFYIDFEGSEDDKEFKFGDMESKYKTRYSAGTRSEYITDDEGKIYTMSVIMKEKSGSLKAYEKFFNYIKPIIDETVRSNYGEGMRIYYAGTVKGRLDEYNTLIHDLQLAGLISGIGIFLLLAIYCRKILAPAIIFLPLSAGILYSFAFSSLFIDNLNVVTSFLFAVLGGLGVEIGIHMFARYNEERSKGAEIESAIFTILFHTGKSAITSGVVVAATFLILIINDFKGFSEFGFITGSGILIIYASYHLLFPPTLILAEKLHLIKFKKIPPEAVTDAKKFPKPKAVLIATGALFLLSCAGLGFTKFEYNFGKLKSNIAESIEAKKKLRKTTTRVNNPAVVLIKDLDDALAIKEYIRKKIEEDEKAKISPVLDVYKSWFDIAQYNQKEKLKVIDEIKALLRDKTIKLVKGEHKKDLDRFKEVLYETKPVRESEIPSSVRDIFFSGKDKSVQISYINAEPKMELDDGRNAIAFAERIENIDTPRGTFHASSDAIIFANVLRTMLSDVPRVVMLSLLCVLVFVFLDFRDWRKTLLVASPIVLGVVIMFGLMFILRMKLNFYNMIIVPTVFGTSIDNSIHIYHRFEEMGKKNLLLVLRTSGGAALMSSLTNIFGFLGLAFANHLGLASIGRLAIVGMSACLFTTLIYFPAMLQWMGEKKK